MSGTHRWRSPYCPSAHARAPNDIHADGRKEGAPFFPGRSLIVLGLRQVAADQVACLFVPGATRTTALLPRSKLNI